ncbi:hypothetical protein MTR_6g024160 [Medicago truncatula]|uniref:Uncharacterized protein n=1 Tax=Medicago truncatula TaxID=3880 RepID=A0A072U745_MEDTR|nr:hypothetical protein MTR_6g024160 [Medicago truncatula]
MTVKLHGYAELSQYEILDLFVIQYISESRNINIDLYNGDNIYALGSIKISRQRSNCTHNYYHGKCFVRSLDILVTWQRVLEEHCSFGLARGFAACCLLCCDRDSSFQLSDSTLRGLSMSKDYDYIKDLKNDLDI